MDENDLPEFTRMLDGTCALLSQGHYTPSEESTTIFFRALACFPIEAVRWALDRHVHSAKFAPTPAELLAILRGADGRPGAEEAWAMAVQARDEARTVVWTAEMAEAWALALPVMELGDEVGARMAFREAYSDRVAAARAALVPARWQVSEGHDAAGRQRAVEEAVRLGRLPADAAPALPAPRGTVPLLAAPEAVQELPADRRQFLADLRERMAAVVERPAATAADMARTIKLKAEQDQLLREMADSQIELPADTRQILAEMRARPVGRLDSPTLAALHTLNAWKREA